MSVFDWSATPFLRLLIPMVFGVILYAQLEWHYYNIIGFVAALWVGSALLLFSSQIIKFHIASGILVQLLMICSGVMLSMIQDESNNPNHISGFNKGKSAIIQGEIINIRERAKKIEAVVDVKELNTDNKNIYKYGKVNCHIVKDSIADELIVGDVLSLEGKISPHFKVLNPNVFDYGKYLNRQQIYNSIYRTSNIKRIGHISTLHSFISRKRNEIINLINSRFKSSQRAAIASSITIGHREDVDQYTKKIFAQTGSMHVLAVSGMHVGIVWGIAGWFIGYLKKRNVWIQIVKFMMSVSVIWGFVLLAGAAPSAIRAAWLFSIISFTKLLQRDANIMHRLTLAAFVMICWDTNLIYNVGFQLSFSAVFGIVGWMPIWQGIIYPTTNLVSTLTQGIGITIGATIGTLPLTMYYFNYFPWTGLLAGFFVSFLAIIVLAIGVLVLIIFWFSYITVELDWLLNLIVSVWEYFVQIMILLVQIFDAIPHSVINNIYLSPASLVLIYIFLISYWIFYFSQKIYSLLIGSVALIGLLSICILRVDDVRSNRDLMIYHDFGQEYIEYFYGSKSLLFSNAEIEIEKLPFLNRPLHLLMGIKSTQYAYFSQQILGDGIVFRENQLQIDGVDILLLNDVPDNKEVLSKKWDYLILQDNPKINLEDILNDLKVGHIVFSATNTSSNIKIWIDSCSRLNIPYTNIKDSGAYRINLNSVSCHS